MRLKNTVLVLAAIVFLMSGIPQTSLAQTSIGASYEIRNEDPQNGFGVRLERGILKKVPIVDLGLRAHFSYFNESNDFSQEGVTIGEITCYDYGLAAVGGVSVGLLSPYIGLGLGSSTLDVEYANLDNDDKDSAFYWNSFVGAKVSPIPLVKPFVEYRFESVSDYKDLNTDIDKSNGRLIFGVSLSF